MTRLAAPAAVLFAATVVLLLVRPLVRGEEAASGPGATTQSAERQPAVTQRSGRRAAPPPVDAQAYYEIRTGDTLGAVADRHRTTVEALVGLNPGVDPTALQVGQRIRVK